MSAYAQGHTQSAAKFLAVNGFIRNDGVQLCMERRGNGPAHVLMLHGWISARRMWYDVAERIDADRFTLHLLDFRGCGLSDRPMLGHDLEGYASDARAAMEAIGQPLLIAGHSMGGKIAQYIAAERPPQLRKLVLVAPGTAKGGTGTGRQRERALDAFGSRAKIEAFQRAAMGAEIRPEAMQRVIDDALAVQRESWFGWYDHGRYVDFFDRLQHIGVPALCIGGGKDPLIPPNRLKREVAQPIHDSLLVTLRDAGHNLPIEAPGEIASAVTQFA